MVFRLVTFQGKEKLAQPITIFVSRASREAIRAIEAKGGKVTAVYYNKLGLKYLLNPDHFGIGRRVPRAALPVRRYLIGMSFIHLSSSYRDYYSDPLKRGYLSSPAVNLSDLGLAPPKEKTKVPLRTIPLLDLLTRSHAILISSAQKTKLRNAFAQAKIRYEQEKSLAETHDYLNGKNRIPKRIPIRQ
jgi:hypothetical protein